MSIVQRYVLQEFIKYFIMILMIVTSLQILIEFIKESDRFFQGIKGFDSRNIHGILSMYR